MTEPCLFRDEVLQAQHLRTLGSVRVARPPSFVWIAGLALTLAAAIVAYALLGEITRKASLPGLLLPTGGLLQLSAPEGGVVAELWVAEGQQVQRGQALLRLVRERRTERGEASAVHAQALQQRRQAFLAERRLLAEQAAAQREALTARLASLVAEDQQAHDDIAALEQRVRLAEDTQARYQQLTRGGFVSALAEREKVEEALDLQLRLRNARRSFQGLQREQQQLRAELRSGPLNLQTSLAQADRALSGLDQEEAENTVRQGLLVSAPQAGVVSGLTQQVGQTVQGGQTLLSLLPLQATVAGAASAAAAPLLQAQLYAPSRTLGFVVPGQRVRLRYAAFPFQKFGMGEGRVLEVSRAPLAPQDLPSGQAQALLGGARTAEPLYRVVVGLASQQVSAYGQPQALKPGMALEADVMLERRAIWEWVLEPVLAAAARLDAGPPTDAPR